MIDLKKFLIFEDFSSEDINDFLNNTKYYKKHFKKGAAIFFQGEHIKDAGIVLAGSIDAILTPSDGNEILVLRYLPGDLIGEAFNITDTVNTMIHFCASSYSEVIFFNINSLITMPVMNTYYARFIHNLINLIANNNITLYKKIRLISQKTLRDKLLTFFTDIALQNSCPFFNLTFTREQLANFVCAERCSVCRELGRMQDEHLISIDSDKITVYPQYDKGNKRQPSSP